MKEFALAELQAVLRTAARGVGAGAAFGEELAEAVAYAALDFSGWDNLRDVFAEPVTSGFDGAQDQVRCLVDAPKLVDALLVSESPLHLVKIDAPDILDLYLRRASHLFDCSLSVTVDGAGWKAVRDDVPTGKGPSDGRIFLPDGLYEFLSGLAARTHVPATEETRLSGAGAGLNDND